MTIKLKRKLDQSPDSPPASLLYGEPAIDGNGNLYIGDPSNTTVKIAGPGGFRPVADNTERDKFLSGGALEKEAKDGMLVWVLSTQKLFTRDVGGAAWTEFLGGGGGAIDGGTI